MKHKPIFFCFGLPKSGTTFLQRSLNLHPEICCPPEQDLFNLFQRLNQGLDQYDRSMAVVDKRTGGNGITPSRPLIAQQVFSYTVHEMLWQQAKEKQIAGINDNSFDQHFDAYQQLFNRPKMLVIFRNPLDRATSSWHHNYRLAKEEQDPKHIQLMEKRGSFEDWVLFHCQDFINRAKFFTHYAKQHDNILIIKYEELIHNKRGVLSQAYQFLGASTDPSLLNQLLPQTEFNAMKKASNNSGFFRSGQTNLGGDQISPELKTKVNRLAKEAYQLLGYSEVFTS